MVLPSVLWRCWLAGSKGIRPVKKLSSGGAGVVICLERGADLHMAQLMPLPLTVYCFSKIQIGFTFLVPAHPGSSGQRAVCVTGMVCCRSPRSSISVPACPAGGTSTHNQYDRQRRRHRLSQPLPGKTRTVWHGPYGQRHGQCQSVSWPWQTCWKRRRRLSYRYLAARLLRVGLQAICSASFFYLFTYFKDFRQLSQNLRDRFSPNFHDW